MLLLAGTLGAIVPKEAGHAVSLGSLHYIFQIVQEEGPGTGIRLRTHGASELTYINGNVLCHISIVQHPEDLPHIALVAIGVFLSGCAGVAPVGVLFGTYGVG